MAEATARGRRVGETKTVEIDATTRRRPLRRIMRRDMMRSLGEATPPTRRAAGGRAVNSRAAIEDVREAALRLVRNLPEAHTRVERPLRNLLFPRSAKAFLKRVYAVETMNCIDRDFEELEDVTRAGLRILQVHMVDLDQPQRTGSRHPRKAIQVVAEKLQEAIEGIERGLPPDPAKRPTREQMMQRLAAHLTSIRLA